MHVRREDVNVEDQREAEHDEQQLRGEVDDREEDVQVGRLADADDVQKDEHDDDRDPSEDVPRVRPQRLPEDREVVRNEERRDRDRDHVIEHLRPGRPERDELVEGVARERGRAAGLREPDRSLRVGRSSRREDDAGDHEDERRQPECDRRGDAERVVDRRSDIAVRGREERRRAEDALEALLSPPPWHRPSLERRGRRRVIPGRSARPNPPVRVSSQPHRCMAQLTRHSSSAVRI